jgi:hypothetical protein
VLPADAVHDWVLGVRQPPGVLNLEPVASGRARAPYGHASAKTTLDSPAVRIWHDQQAGRSFIRYGPVARPTRRQRSSGVPFGVPMIGPWRRLYMAEAG